jgi:hypothetical protein
MPVYRFEFVGEPGVSPVMIDLPDAETAIEEARKSMAEAVMDSVIERSDPSNLATKIYDGAGYHISTVRFQDVISDSDDASGKRTG